VRQDSNKQVTVLLRVIAFLGTVGTLSRQY